MLRTRRRCRMKGSLNAITLTGRGSPAVADDDAGAAVTSPVSSTSASANGSSTQNRLPMCSVLSKPIVPPMASVSRLAMLVPNPVPPNPRASVVSTCSNASNRRARADSGMPIPVSLTVNFRRRLPGADSTQHTSTCTEP